MRSGDKVLCGAAKGQRSAYPKLRATVVAIVLKERPCALKGT